MARTALSRNIEDLRRRSRTRAAVGIGGVGLIAVPVVGYFFGIDVTNLLQDQGPRQIKVSTQMTEAYKTAGQFVAVTLADAEDVWAYVFQDKLGRQYKPSILVLFKGAKSSPCGGASGASGPFYCPVGRKAISTWISL